MHLTERPITMKIIFTGSQPYLVEVDQVVYANVEIKNISDKLFETVVIIDPNQLSSDYDQAFESLTNQLQENYQIAQLINEENDQSLDLPKIDDILPQLVKIEDILNHYRQNLTTGGVGHGESGKLYAHGGLYSVKGRAPRVSLHGGNRFNITIPGWKIVATHQNIARQQKDQENPRDQLLDRLLGSSFIFDLEEVLKRIAAEKKNNPDFKWGSKEDWDDLNNRFKNTNQRDLQDLFKQIDWGFVTHVFQRPTASTEQLGYSFIMRTRDIIDSGPSEKFIVFGYRSPRGVVTRPLVFNLGEHVSRSERIRNAQSSDFPVGFLAWAWMVSKDQNRNNAQAEHHRRIRKYYASNDDRKTFEEWLKKRKEDLKIDSERESRVKSSKEENDDLNDPKFADDDDETRDKRAQRGLLDPTDLKREELVRRFNEIGKEGLWTKIIPSVKGGRYFTHAIKQGPTLDGKASRHNPGEHNYIIFGRGSENTVPSPWDKSPWVIVPNKGKTKFNMREAVPEDFYKKLLWHAFHFLHKDEDPNEIPPFKDDAVPYSLMVSDVDDIDVIDDAIVRYEDEISDRTGGPKNIPGFKAKQQKPKEQKSRKKADDDVLVIPDEPESPDSYDDDLEPGDYEAEDRSEE